MPQEISGLLRRSVRGEVARTGGDNAPNLAESHGDELAVGKRADPDRHVNPFGNRIDALVADRQVDRDVRILSEKIRQQPGQTCASQMPFRY